MKRICLLLTVVLVATVFCFPDESQAACKRKKATVVAAYEFILHQGRQESASEHSFSIVLEWKSKTPPQSFFWSHDGALLPCRVMQYPADGRVTQTLNVELRPEAIEKGTKFVLVPMVGGKYAIPESIGTPENHTVYFSIDDKKWWSLTPKTIIKKITAAP